METSGPMMVDNPTACYSPSSVTSVTRMLCFSILLLLPCSVKMLNTDTGRNNLKANIAQGIEYHYRAGGHSESLTPLGG